MKKNKKSLENTRGKQKSKKKKSTLKKRLVKRLKELKKVPSPRTGKAKTKSLTKKKIDEVLKMERLISRGKERVLSLMMKF